MVTKYVLVINASPWSMLPLSTTGLSERAIATFTIILDAVENVQRDMINPKREVPKVI
jgi:hypothetical protein